MNQQTVTTLPGPEAEAYVRGLGFEPGVGQFQGEQSVLYMLGDASASGDVDVVRYVVPFEEPTA